MFWTSDLSTFWGQGRRSVADQSVDQVQIDYRLIKEKTNQFIVLKSINLIFELIFELIDRLLEEMFSATDNKSNRFNICELEWNEEGEMKKKEKKKWR